MQKKTVRHLFSIKKNGVLVKKETSREYNMYEFNYCNKMKIVKMTKNLYNISNIIANELNIL